MMQDEGGVNLNQSFTNQAINRQVNYISEKHMDMDFSQFDKLHFVHQTAWDDDLLPSNTDSFKAFLEKERKKRINKLCNQFEEIKQSEVLQNNINLEQNYNEEGKVEESHGTILLKKISGFFAI